VSNLRSPCIKKRKFKEYQYIRPMFTGTVMLNENQENVLTIMPDVTGQGNANSSLLGIHTTSRLSF
jgi:hypothetical protein